MLYDWELYHSIFHNLDHGGRAHSIGLFKVVLDMYDQHLSRTKYFAGDHYSLADLVHIPKLMN
jgi:glutathione S-transferase